MRFKTMQGYNVWRRAGWDTHGLPVELEVEKNLGVRNKNDIVEKIGVERFVEECRRLVDYYISHWVKSSKRLGLWLDYESAYVTMKDEYIEHVWCFLKYAFEKGYLEESYRVVPYCPRCQTSLSSHEVAQGYEEKEDPSIYVKFRVEGLENTFLIVWTTTPWTLPANVALAVHPNLDYVKVKVGNETWILGLKPFEKLKDKLSLRAGKIEVFRGQKLLGLRYVPPLLDEVPLQGDLKGEWVHRVVLADFVTEEEGTGVVHIAPAHGPEDYVLSKKYGLPAPNPVNEEAKFTQLGGKYQGLVVWEANFLIIEDLRRKGLLVLSEKILHTYPHCWRCHTPLIYRLDKQWFIKVKPIKEKMVEENKKVYWRPEWAGRARFSYWLENAEDWCISRSRFWGTPLPVWKCSKCGKVEVIGSKEEMVSKAVKVPKRIELHRPWVDEVVLKCPSCGGEMYREPFVVDVWLDSGVAHFASINYLREKELFKKLYPYDFITEAVDQTRGWFYTLLFTGVMLFGKSPYKKVLCQGHVLDSMGRKMSKSKRNVIWVLDAIEKYGADPLRVYLVSKAAPWESIRFKTEEIEKVLGDLNVMYNVFLFAKTYMELDNFKPSKEVKVEKLEDKWILSKLSNVVEEVTKSLEVLEPHKALRTILGFLLNDVSRTYIRLIRRRVWIEEYTREKEQAYYTLYKILDTTLRLLAPFTPFLAEYLYQFFLKPLCDYNEESVHFLKWPSPGERYPDIEKVFEVVRKVAAAGLAARNRAGLKLRWPLKTVYIKPSSIEIHKACLQAKDLIAEFLNVKNVIVLEVSEKPSFVKLKVKPHYRVLGRRLKSLAPKVYKILEKLGNHQIKKLMETGELSLAVDDIKVKVFTSDLEILEETPEHVKVEEFQGGTLYLDCRRSQLLVKEAIVREIIRRIQYMRKELGLKISEQSVVYILTGDKTILEACKEYINYIAEETRSQKILLNVTPPEGGLKRNWNINETKVLLVIFKSYYNLNSNFK